MATISMYCLSAMCSMDADLAYYGACINHIFNLHNGILSHLFYTVSATFIMLSVYLQCFMRVFTVCHVCICRVPFLYLLSAMCVFPVYEMCICCLRCVYLPSAMCVFAVCDVCICNVLQLGR